ncbi:MAG TPA: TIGR04083 family peptide-modifying radical SAM enzyme [Methanospirillum sp.]|nr:TIGR04083 family peptide-modifying radical SAM enzyme [Methanospirillum sp.]
MKNAFHVMIIPTLGCPSNCAYCWSSEEGSPVMSLDTIRATVAWLEGFRSDPVTFTFHGGEPLLAGAEFYRQALPLLAGLKHLTPEFAMQTNLWKMTDEIADVLAAYAIPLGSSIDGPEVLNDSQRGEGYFCKTMEGYAIARSHGLRVSFICTFTNRSVEQKEEIFRFFMENALTMKLHPALPSLRDDNPKRWALSPDAYGELLVYLLDAYLANQDKIEIMNINDLCKCVFTRRGTVCTFADCMANTFAIGPDGSIYPCYRFVGMPWYVMGNVRDRPGIDALAQSESWQLMQQYKEYVNTTCSSCSHIRYCRGGCPYNAIAPAEGKITGVDPHCIAYKRIFGEISNRINEEMYGDDSAPMGMPGSFNRQSPGKKPGIMSLMHRMIMR